MRRVPRGPGIGVVLAVTGGLLGFLASSWFPYGWLIAYPLTGMFFGALLAVWLLWPWEDPLDWRSRFWQRMPEPTHGRIAELDALRGFAVAMVCGCHLWPESRIFYYGWSGVDLFFVLSGYLITADHLEERPGTGLPQGVLRPAHAPDLAHLLPRLDGHRRARAHLVRSRGWVDTGLGYYLTYTQNLFVSQIPDDSVYRKCYGPTWSLARGAVLSPLAGSSS